ncbi:carbohydrate-binding domain-containing protein [Marinisporobacter balticus]|uniref:Uncharacterized protein DUF4353 n=2 Tax=Marinisporobacter balticus TaxID=2018667 RepID=A0A4R2KAA2_9FIRM|nr:carbohydrate-binding domain-containing protein [Marinisporobacter balticus]TCO70391.1 uncharacterized protein DUF4353 [Marinisporobacter balticus]
MKFKKIITILLCIAIIVGCFTGCAGNLVSANGNNLSDTSSSQTKDNTNASVTITDTSKMFSNRDKEIGYDEEKCVIITLNDDNIQSSGRVKINDTTVTITDEGTYLLKGSLTNGQIIVDAEKTDKIQLVLDSVSIGNTYSAPIYVKQADKVFITLASGTMNTLCTNGEFTKIDDNHIDAVIYSKDDLTLNGKGELSISTEYGNGITSKNDLVITSGKYEIKISEHGLEGNDSVRIANGSFEITSGQDGIHSENSDDPSLGFIYIADGSFNITSETDGIDGAISIQVDAGDFNIITGGGSGNASTESKGEFPPDLGKQDKQSETNDTPSEKAIKANGNIIVNNGTFNVNSSDDSIHANSDIIINGATFELSSGNDGIHADSNVTINSGNINILKSYEGVEGQSIDIVGGKITLVASDDGFNAAGGNEDTFATDENAYIKISGGIIKINARGDGVDSNGHLYVTGGETYVSGPTNNGNGAIDYNGTADISGGIFIAVGSSGMAQNFGNESTQGSILVNTQSMQNGAITLKDSSGKELVNYTPEKEYNCVVISSPDIKKGETYTIVMGSDSQTIEMTNLIYGSGGGMGGGRPKRPDGENRGHRPTGDRSERPGGEINGERPQPPTLGAFPQEGNLAKKQ